jgi:ParB-like chromosome segregation protein Spo0J
VPRAKGAAAVDRVAKRLESLTVEWCDPLDLRPNPWNPNRQNDHEFHMLCMSIEDAGFTQPIMVVEIRESDLVEWQDELASGYAVGERVIVDGEHRWRAAQHLGITPIPYVQMPYGAAQARLSTLQMNRARGSEDIQLAAEVLRDLEKLGVLDLAGARLDMSDAELGRMLEDIDAPDAMPQDRRVVVDESGAEVYVTPAEARADREYQERVRAAKSREEREAWLAERQSFRLVLTFAGDEADLVREALRPDPASKVVEWCRAKGAPAS